MFKPIKIGDREYKLRYGIRSIISIEKGAGQFLTESVLKILQKQTDLPISREGKIPLELVAPLVELDPEAMIWIFGKGLEWDGSGATPDDAYDLYDAYMDATPELDTGERYREFKDAIYAALAMARGMDASKNAIRARKARRGAGSEPQKSASDISGSAPQSSST